MSDHATAISRANSKYDVESLAILRTEVESTLTTIKTAQLQDFDYEFATTQYNQEIAFKITRGFIDSKRQNTLLDKFKGARIVVVYDKPTLLVPKELCQHYSPHAKIVKSGWLLTNKLELYLLTLVSVLLFVYLVTSLLHPLANLF
jgi:hypothetical protein